MQPPKPKNTQPTSGEGGTQESNGRQGGEDTGKEKDEQAREGKGGEKKQDDQDEKTPKDRRRQENHPSKKFQH